MRRISEHVYAEIYFWGCNPGFVATRDGVVMIDQTRLPREVAYVTCRTYQEVAEAIRSMGFPAAIRVSSPSRYARATRPPMLWPTIVTCRAPVAASTSSIARASCAG